MLIAFFADIHANRHAFSACLADARQRKAERIALAGDYVGYGADPEWCLDTVMDLVGQGAVAVLGNHDNAVGNPRESLNVEAQAAMEWTRGRLSLAQQKFLAELPLTVREDNRLIVHAEASAPRKWTYVRGIDDAVRSLNAPDVPDITICGHIHRPAIYSLSSTAKITSFTPVSDASVPLLPGRKWLLVLGAVGQPRDGNPAASYALLDTTKREVTYCRVPYDVAAAQKAIRDAGLPPSLAERLSQGR